MRSNAKRTEARAEKMNVGAFSSGHRALTASNRMGKTRKCNKSPGLSFYLQSLGSYRCILELSRGQRSLAPTLEQREKMRGREEGEMDSEYFDLFRRQQCITTMQMRNEKLYCQIYQSIRLEGPKFARKVVKLRS